MRRWRKKYRKSRKRCAGRRCSGIPKRIRELKGQLEEHEERLAKKTDRWVELAE